MDFNWRSGDLSARHHYAPIEMQVSCESIKLLIAADLVFSDDLASAASGVDSADFFLPGPARVEEGRTE